MKWRKAMLMSLCLLFALGCAACGGKSGTNGTSETNGTSGTSETSEAGGEESAASEKTEGINIEIWHPRGAGANGDMIASSVAEFNKTIGAEKGITVTEVYQGGYDDVIAATMNAVAAGESPEIVVIENSTGTPTLAAEGILANLDELVARDSWNLDDVQSGLLTYCYNDDELIALPYIRSTQVMFYNKTMTDELGVEIPMDKALTLDEFEKLCRDLTVYNADGSVDVYGFSLQSNDWYTNTFLQQLGSDMYSADGTSVPSLEDGSLLKLLQTWDGWVKEGWCLPFVSTDEEAYLEEQFSLGKIACILDSTGKMGNIFSAVEELGNPFEIGVAFLPTFDKPLCATGGGNMAIVETNNSAEEIDAAWEFMKFLLTPEQDALNHVNTGYVLSTKTAAEQDIVKELWENEPYRQVGFNQLAYAKDGAISDYSAEWRAALKTAVSSVIQTGTWTPEEAIEFLKGETKSIFQ